MSRDNWRDQLDDGWSPQTRCDMGLAMAWLGGAALFLTGVVVAVLSVRSWKW